MKIFTKTLFITLLTLAPLSIAQAQSTDIAAELRELKAQVAQLRAQSSESWMTQQRAHEIKALISEVLADADTRASHAGSGLTAGHDKNFFLASEDGNFRLNIGGRIQARYAYTQADGANDSDGNPSDTNLGGFTARRTRVKFFGHVINPNLTYYVEPEFNNSGGAFTLKQAWSAYTFDNNITLKVGEYKGNFLREEQISDGRQITVERTNVNEFFTIDYSEGLQLSSSTDNFRWWAAIHDGREAENVDWDDDATDFAANARIEFMPNGAWSQWKDFQAWSGEEDGLLLGAAIDYELAEGGQGSAYNWNDMLQYTADISTEFNQLGLYAAYIARHVNHDSNGTGLTGKDYTQQGVILQANAFIIPNKLDLFARYEYIDFDGAKELSGNGNSSTSAVAPLGQATGVSDNQQIYTLGANYYFNKHDFKITTDFLWAPDGIRQGESGSETLTSNLNEDDQYVFRTQLQLQF